MRKIFILFTVFWLPVYLSAQYITSGSGTVFTPDLLADSAGSQFTAAGSNYTLSGEIVISTGDTLMLSNADSLFFETTGDLRIEGTMIAESDQLLVITAVDSTLGYAGITFDESVGSVLQNIEFRYGGGVKLLYSDVYFNNCAFYKMTDANGSGAINLLQSNPVIEYCNFTQNFRSAISSGATAASSPVIRYNNLYHNNTENGNRPQINLGTSDGVNDIVIRGNVIDGNYDETGGLSLATLAGGNVSAIVDSNVIINNRYGINLQGAVEANISHNHILDNNLEDNPFYGGSGIAFSSGAQATVAHNIIRNNLWGITIQNGAQPNVGEIDPDTVNIGHNYIYENGNGGVLYNLYNNSDGNIYAQNNWWGTSSVSEAEVGIIDHADDTTLGVVYYEPIYILNTEKEFHYFAFDLNDTVIEASIDQQNLLITATLPEGSDINSLAPLFEVSEYARVLVDGNLQQSGLSIQDFADTLQYTVVAEDSTSVTYKVAVDVATSIESGQQIAVDIFPNPFRSNLNLKSSERIVRATVFNLTGQMVQDIQSPGHNVAIRTRSWMPGMYLMRLQLSDGTHLNRKLIKK